MEKENNYDLILEKDIEDSIFNLYGEPTINE